MLLALLCTSIAMAIHPAVPTASAPAATGELAFPLVPRGTADPVELVLRPGALDDLGGFQRVCMSGVELPGRATVELDLERVDVPAAGLEIRVDGALAPNALAEVELALFKGQIAGEAGSDVFLALSPLGSRGWIWTEGELIHLLAGPGENGDWNQAVSRFATEAELAASGASAPSPCRANELALAAPGGGNAAPISAGGGTSSMVTTTTLWCKVALTTDYELYQIFGNQNAELTYVLSLFGAGSARYFEQINTVLEIVHLALYTTPADPWTAGDSLGRLYQLQSAWMGAIPNGGQLGHLFSGASLGGGVAWLDVLCNSSYGFAVSGNLSGTTPFPIVQGPLNWDFVVWTHETGHNFGSPHTHEFCPPLDQCAPPSYFGPCQSSQVCTTSGTIMSYCHLCAGGLGNVYPYFHASCASLMRARAEASCFSAFCTTPTSYCVAAPTSSGSGGAMSSSGSTSVAAASFTLHASNLPPSVPGIFYYGNHRTQTAFGNGWRCVSGSIFRLPVGIASAAGVMTRSLDFGSAPVGAGPGKIDPGEVWNFQSWFRDAAAGGANFNLSNGLTVHFCP